MKWFLGRFKYAFDGFIHGIFKDRSIMVQAFFGLMVLVFAFLFHCTLNEWMWLILCITLVLVTETINSCIEQCVDYISMEIDPRAKKIKDMAAAAVSIVCIFSAIIGIFIFLPKLIGG